MCVRVCFFVRMCVCVCVSLARTHTLSLSPSLSLSISLSLSLSPYPNVIGAMNEVILVLDAMVPQDTVQKLHAVMQIETVTVAHIEINLQIVFADAFCVISCHMGWLELVGSIKLQVSFAKEPCKRDYILQKRPII